MKNHHDDYTLRHDQLTTSSNFDSKVYNLNGHVSWQPNICFLWVRHDNEIHWQGPTIG